MQPPRIGLLARMRVGTKLMLLVLIPTCGLLVFASVTAVDYWREADRVREFVGDERLSSKVAEAAQALREERAATTLSLAGVRSFERRVEAAQRALDGALRRADPGDRPTPVDVAGRVRTAQRRLASLRRRIAAGSLGPQEVVEEYGLIARSLIGIVRDLDGRAPTLALGRAADAHTAIVDVIEGGGMERVTAALALVRGAEFVRVRGTIVEGNGLDAFRRTASPGLVAELDRLLSSPSASLVQRARDVLIERPQDIRREVSLADWLAASDTRSRGMVRLDDGTDEVLRARGTAAVDAAEASARRAVAASVGVLGLVVSLGLILRRSITRPLGEVSAAARGLSAGELPSGVSYVGRDEIGEVAAAFRGLQATVDRVDAEIRAMNVAVDDNRLDHRADVATFDGRWADLLGGVNDTMAAFAGLHDRREEAERLTDRIFELSHDLLCVAGFDGYFKRVNPAFERLLGYPMETLLSRPSSEFVHPDDRAAREEGHAKLEAGDDVLRFELRQLCSDGSVRRVEWSARALPEERLLYALGRDVTETRRAAEEQAALRRVATLVAKGVAPAETFAAVAREVRALFDASWAGVLRFEPDASIAVLGSAPAGSGAEHEDVAEAVAAAGSATRTDGAVGAPIVVEDRVWGVIAAAEGAEPLALGGAQRLARFTELVATAIANAESRAEVAASRARVLAAADAERRRVVRDLHDGAQQGLVQAILALQIAARAQEDDDEGAASLVAEALEHAQRANRELRELSHGILPVSLTSGGLADGVENLVSRVPLPVATDVSVDRLPSVVEATAYFVVAEALTNIVKHAHAARAEVNVHVVDGTLRIAVRDDGVGGARPDGSGMVGLRDRLEALDGRLRLDSPMGRGTLVAAEIPLSGHPAAPRTSTRESATGGA